MWEIFHQPNTPERKTGAKMFVLALAQNEFGAAAAHIQKQQWLDREGRIRRHPLKNQISFLVTGKDLNFQSGCLVNGIEEFPGIDGIARRAGGDDADGAGFARAGRCDELSHGSGSLLYRRRLQPVGLVKAAP